MSVDTKEIIDHVADWCDRVDDVVSGAVTQVSERVKGTTYELDEDAEFPARAWDSSEVSYLKSHARHWKEQAEHWRRAFAKSEARAYQQ